MAGFSMLSQRRVRLMAELRTRKGRRKHGLVLVEGVRACAEAMASGASIRFAAAAPRLRDTSDGSELLTRLIESGIEPEDAPKRILASVTDTETPQGIALVCEEPAPPTAAFLEGGRYLVLDGLQDPGNAGTLVRAAVAFGIDGVVALDGTVDLWGAKAVRAAAGMTFRMPVHRLDVDTLLDACRDAGLTVVLAEVGGDDVSAWADGGSGWALAVGNEGRGCRPELRTAAPGRVQVPMPGPAESLNAGVAGSILLYSMTRDVPA